MPYTLNMELDVYFCGQWS